MDEDVEVARKNYIEKAESIVKSIDTFENAEIFHGVVNNTIAFNKDGLIFITTYGKSKLLQAEDIKNVKFGVPKKNDFPLLFYCILNTKDKDMPEIKFLLTTGEGTSEEAANLYYEIESRIKAIKK